MHTLTTSMNQLFLFAFRSSFYNKYRMAQGADADDISLQINILLSALYCITTVYKHNCFREILNLKTTFLKLHCLFLFLSRTEKEYCIMGIISEAVVWIHSASFIHYVSSLESCWRKVYNE